MVVPFANVSSLNQKEVKVSNKMKHSEQMAELKQRGKVNKKSDQEKTKARIAKINKEKAKKRKEKKEKKKARKAARRRAAKARKYRKKCCKKHRVPSGDVRVLQDALCKKLQAANTVAGINKGVAALQDTAKKTAARIAKKAAKERRENCKKDLFEAEKKKCEEQRAEALEKTTTVVRSSDDDKMDGEQKCNAPQGSLTD